ncbi:MAG: type II toxin-antitoxin system mRNA interferase toxin, RelE/StbE family [Candidatus Saccharimonadales bacterium]
MIVIDFHKNFRKQAEKLKPVQKERLKTALRLFQEKPNDPSLYNHPLTGQWAGHHSVAFGGDWRAHYKVIDQNTVLFVAVGTHNQLYK